MPKATRSSARAAAKSAPHNAVDKLQRRIAALETENTELKRQLEQYIEQWDTLDGDAVNALVYLSRHKRGVPKEVAKGNGVNLQIADSYLKFLARHDYVRAPATTRQPYTILSKGIRYLEERGLLD